MIDDILEKKYNQVFENVCAYVDEQRNQGDFFLDDLKKMLETEYINEGNGWDGRSEIQQTVNAATIAAYQHKIVEWEKEINL